MCSLTFNSKTQSKQELPVAVYTPLCLYFIKQIFYQSCFLLYTIPSVIWRDQLGLLFHIFISHMFHKNIHTFHVDLRKTGIQSLEQRNERFMQSLSQWAAFVGRSTSQSGPLQPSNLCICVGYLMPNEKSHLFMFNSETVVPDLPAQGKTCMWKLMKTCSPTCSHHWCSKCSAALLRVPGGSVYKVL